MDKVKLLFNFAHKLLQDSGDGISAIKKNSESAKVASKRGLEDLKKMDEDLKKMDSECITDDTINRLVEYKQELETRMNSVREKIKEKMKKSTLENSKDWKRKAWEDFKVALDSNEATPEQLRQVQFLSYAHGFR
jgi:hypothetical protein